MDLKGDTLFHNSDFWTLAFFIFGTLWGSFANVAISRIPEGKSVVWPRSHCRSCEKLIPWYEKFHIISWHYLKGTFSSCNQKISWRYPFVELLVGVLFVACFLRFGWTWFLGESLVFVLGLVICTFIDFDHFLLPDALTLPGLVIGLLGAALNPERNFMPSFVGFLLGGGFLWSVAYFYYLLRKEDGLGGGDIKLIAWIGAVLEWRSIAFVIIVSSLLGSIVGILMSLKQKKGLKTVIPFGPYLALGAVIYMLVGTRLADWHWDLFFPFLSN